MTMEDASDTKTSAQSFRSIQTKMIVQTMTLITIIFSAVLAFIIIKDMRTVNQSMGRAEKNIRNSIVVKGNLLAKNNSMAMAGMAWDYAFTSIQTLVASAVADDPDILYGIYMDREYMAWAYASFENPSGKVVGKTKMRDERSLWAGSLQAADYRVFSYQGKEVIEFCAPVTFENSIIGFIRYGICTESMHRELADVLKNSKRSRNQVIVTIVTLGLFFLIISFFFVRKLSHRITRPIKSLVDQVRRIAHGKCDTPVVCGSNDEIGQLESDVEIMRVAIGNFTENLEQLVLERTNQLHETNVRLEQAMGELWGEMALAKKIQTALLPSEPFILGYSLCAYMEPADEVGGNYYDVINAAEKDWVVIGDVSGHGIPAGLIMMMTQTAIKIAVIENPQSQPSDLIKNVNRVIAHNISRLKEDKYMTLTVLAVHQQGVVHFSGLHQDILIYRAATHGVECVETHGMWIGMVDDIDTMVTDAVIKINRGDTVLLYTDGVTEVHRENQMFGDARLLEFFTLHGKQSPAQIKDALIETLKAYKREDDVTFMLIKRDI